MNNFKMKIALILGSNTYAAPFLQYYIKMLIKYNIDYDIIIWNKDNIFEQVCISYNKYTDLSKPRYTRIFNFFGFIVFVIKQLNKNRYDKLVVFDLSIGPFLHPFIRNRFKNKFYFDIRDYTNAYRFYSFMMPSLIKNSFATAISSPGFLEWLPESRKYNISHNYNFDENIEFCNLENDITHNHTILTIGQLRDFESNKKIIDAFKNNSKYDMKFVGSGIAYEPLLKYTSKHNIKNIVFTGRYLKKDEIKYLENVSLMNIVLEDNLNSKTLMTNRIYLAVSNRIPVIVNSNSTQAEYVEKYNLGIIIDNLELVEKSVTNYLQNFDRQIFVDGCKSFFLDIRKDQRQFEKSFEEFIKC